MRLQGIPKAKIAEELGIQDVGRLKIWMRKYREQGDFGLMEHRGRRKEYKDLEREVKRLRLENDVLKKWLEIFSRGGKTLRFQVVDELRHRHSVKDLCKFLGVFPKRLLPVSCPEEQAWQRQRV